MRPRVGEKKTKWRVKGKWRRRTLLFFLWSELIRVQFYFIFIFSFDPSWSESIRVDPTRTGGPSWSGPTFVPAYLKCLFVQCRKYHKSRWNGAAELHISVDLLCGITAAELHNSVDLLCGTTDAELHNSPVNLLCGTTDAEPNNPVWCMHQA